MYVIGGLELNEDTVTVSVDGNPVKMTPMEFKILALLMKNPGRVFSAEEIYERVWNEKAVNTDTIMVHVRNIRDKIEINPKDPKYLKVVWGVGYKIENNHKTKLIIGAWAVLFVSVLNLIFIPLIQGRAETLLEQETENNSQNTNVSMNENGVQDLYRGLYVLYLEANQEQSTDRMDAASLLLDTDSFSEQWLSGQGETAEEVKNEIDKAEASQAFNDAISEWKQQFYERYPYVDVCYELLPDGAVSSNTDRPLKSLLNGAEPDKKTLEELQRQYAVYMVISFDEKGIMSIENVYGKI